MQKLLGIVIFCFTERNVSKKSLQWTAKGTQYHISSEYITTSDKIFQGALNLIDWLSSTYPSW